MRVCEHLEVSDRNYSSERKVGLFGTEAVENNVRHVRFSRVDDGVLRFSMV